MKFALPILVRSVVAILALTVLSSAFAQQFASIWMRAHGISAESYSIYEPPFLVEGSLENGPHWVEARADLATFGLEAAALSVSTSPEVTSATYGVYETYLDIRNPALPANSFVDMVHNFTISGSMRVRANDVANQASVYIIVDGPGPDWASEQTVGRMYFSRGLAFPFTPPRAELSAFTDQFIPNNIWAEEDGSRKIWTTVTQATDGYYRQNVSIPVRIVIKGTRVNGSGPAAQADTRLRVQFGVHAGGDSVSDFRATLTYADQNPIVPAPDNPEIPRTEWTFGIAGEYEDWEPPVLPGPLTVETATGSGTATLIADGGTIEEQTLAAVAQDALATSPPATVEFAHGFFDLEFIAADDVLEQALALSVALPDLVEEGTRWFFLDETDQWQVIDLADSSGSSLTIPLDAAWFEETGSLNLLGGPGLPPPTIFRDRFETEFE